MFDVDNDQWNTRWNSKQVVHAGITFAIPEGCVSIGSRAFADCKNLVYVYIPASVTDVAGDAFEGCPNVVLDRAAE